MDHPFRSAVFGGFNRQDVLTYLEATAQEAARQQEELQQKLDSSLETVTRQDADLTDQQEQLERLGQENESLKAQLEQANVALSSCRTECSQKNGELAAAQCEIDALKARVAALEPDASAYAAVKERTAGVELEAHRRAQAVQEEAEQQASQLRRQMEQWFQKVEREYDALRAQIESTVSHAADQLGKAEASLEKVTVLMEEQDVALAAIAQDYSRTDPAKIAAPMPIPENE
ncbi:hypothetical protein [Pseudoflavonifractor phocaeensis]|uniref:hypothetical protein n=1 Tax=Pseudoflavonifractor phocaeensis TaxID=1870988 RepID=UPI001F24D55E|nr:hypothetical protein [Pseudoflavonifractor phocaeensis]MCF2660655.1 hypothetical protein [Pseudoflavonifractor phocaeensis]